MEFVKEPKDLAAYLSDQKKKKNMGGEFAWQDMMIRWRWSKDGCPRASPKRLDGSGWLGSMKSPSSGKWCFLRGSSAVKRPFQVEHWPRWTDFPAEADIFQSVFRG